MYVLCNISRRLLILPVARVFDCTSGVRLDVKISPKMPQTESKVAPRATVLLTKINLGLVNPRWRKFFGY